MNPNCKLPTPAPSVSTATLLLLPLALLAAVLVIVYPNEFALQSSLAGATTGLGPTERDGAVVRAAPDFRLLIGVLTLPNRYERRHLLRAVYSLQQPNLTARVDVRFVFCRLASEEQRVLVALEAMRYGDVVELDCPENMDNGKTLAYFSSVPALFGERAYDFVMKTDDDTFFRLPQLVESLNREGQEPGGREAGHVRLPGAGPVCAHELVPDTIAVHRLKDSWRWATTLKYFNFTSGLKPSKFYPIN